MTDITLPDGYVLKGVPEGTTKAQIAAKLKGAHGTGTPPSDEFRLGEFTSGIARPVLGAVNSLATLPMNAGVEIGNAVNRAIGQSEMPLPSKTGQDLIDSFTTKPSSTMGKVAEGVDTMLAGGVIPTGAPAAATKAINPIVQRLSNEGVTMTPGQRSGGIMNWLEQQLGKIHPSVKQARGNAVEQWNVARLNEALTKAGKPKVPDGIKGRDALEYTYNQLQEHYTTIMRQMKLDPNTGKSSLKSEVEAIEKAASHLDEKQAKTLKSVVKDVTSGKPIKEIDEKLRGAVKDLGRGDYQDRQLAEEVKKIQLAVKNKVREQNPGLAEEKEALDSAYARYKTSSKASLASKSGSATPFQRLQAIKNRDVSKDKNSFSTGKAPGQQEAEEAGGILGNTEPDSGTPAGLAMLTALTQGPAWALGHPLLGAGLVGGPMAMYSQPVLKALQDAAVSPGGTKALQEALSKALTVGVAGEVQ